MEQEPPVGALRWHFNDCVLDESSLQIQVQGEAVDVERKPLEVLRFLLRHAGEVVTKDEILEAVWPGRILSDTVLAKAVSRLREVLRARGAEAIRTVHGYGYRLVAEVRVEHLAPSPLTAPSLGLKAGDRPPLRPNWRLVEHLDSGGRGEVWRARQEPGEEQRVLKFALDESALGSLKREISLNRLLRQALGETAPLVPVLDWNLQQPPFFIELPYLPLGSLAEWAESRGGLANLPLALRLELAAQIAEAASAAHGVGVLHKDLKPGNVLVSGSADAPRLLLADFGSGAVLSGAPFDALGITRMGLTQAADDPTSGTPLYFAPEVLAGQPPSVRSDNYALGVLLYQLVVGDFRKPLSPGWERDIEDPLLREDIAAAADGNPQHRLGDAGELARRLRGLDRRRAERASAALRVESERRSLALAEATRQENQRLRTRRRWLLALLAVLSLGLLLSLKLYRDAAQARAEALAAATTSDAVSHFLADDLLAGANPVKVDVSRLTVKDLLDGASQNIERRFADQPVAEARVRQAIASSYVFLGNNDDAVIQIRASWRILERLLGRQDPRLFAVAELTSGYADGLEPEDLLLWQRVLDEIVARRGGADRLSLKVGHMLGSGYYFHGQVEKAVRTLEATMAGVRRLSPPDHELEALTLRILGRAYNSQDRYPEAERAARESLALIPGLPDDGPESPFMAAELLELVIALRQQARYDDAEPVLQRALAIANKNAGPTSAQVVSAKVELGQMRLEQGRYPEARQVMEEVLQARISQYGRDHRQVYLVIASLAELETAQRRWPAAEARSREALAGFIRLRDDPARAIPRDSQMVVRTQIGLAEALRRQGRLAEARQQLDGLSPAVLQASWTMPLRKLGWLRAQGLLHRDEGQAAASQAELREALTLARRYLGEAHPTSLAVAAELAGG